MKETRKVELDRGAVEFSANVWEKYGKKIVYFESGSIKCSWDVEKQEWREAWATRGVGIRTAAAIAAVFGDLMEIPAATETTTVSETEGVEPTSLQNATWEYDELVSDGYIWAAWTVVPGGKKIFSFASTPETALEMVRQDARDLAPFFRQMVAWENGFENVISILS